MFETVYAVPALSLATIKGSHDQSIIQSRCDPHNTELMTTVTEGNIAGVATVLKDIRPVSFSLIEQRENI